MNSKVLQTLEYKKITDQLLDFVVTAAGEVEARDLKPSSDLDTVNQDLNETEEGAVLDRLKGGIPLAQLADIEPHLQRLKIQASLSGQEIAAIGKILVNTRAVAHFFEVLADDPIGRSVPLLADYAQRLATLESLSTAIEQAIDENGRLTDQASPKLAQLRGKIVGRENEIKQRMQAYTRGKRATYLSEPIVTKRLGRYVIPVRSEYRHQVAGVVHDQSQSGQTFYIEPQDVVALSNQISELAAEERAEENRILADLSAQLAEHTEELGQNVALLGHLDFVNAKARLAARLDGQRPTVDPDQKISLQQAWHPLLNPKVAVANDIDLGEDYQTLIITGPNTGGKTITIKTVGLLQLMAQSGLFITVRQPSTVGLFDEVFADIGDEQSIEQNLSTFSSHMANIKSMLPHINAKSLVIFDELGAGTDPAEGAALAMAILDRVTAQGALTIATTHYPELKLFAFERPETSNASMVFDVDTLKPTYQLLIGVPGQSNAIAIAKRLGFDQELLDDATGLTNPEDQQLNSMIADLVSQREAVKTERAKIEATEKSLDQERRAVENQQLTLEKDQAQLMLNAKKEANHIVSKTRKEADRLIKEIRQERLNQGNSAGLSEQDLQARRKSLEQLKQSDHLEKNKVLQRAKRAKELNPGDEVLVRTYGQTGTLVKKHGQHQWEVEMGILKMLVDDADLEKASAPSQPKAKKAKRPTRVVKAKANSQPSANIRAKLDLRGFRYEAALAELDRYLDSAVLSNLNPVEIIHGKGSGALRQGVTQFLRSDRRVANFHFASANAGGDGATIVELK